jgi:chemotaxis protein methyltransferase CheR
VWSVPCATGEEPLTLAMMLDAAGWFQRAQIDIVGSDASPAAIALAQVGAYRERSLRGVTSEQRERYFTKDGDRWVVDRAIHRRVTWSIVNLRSCAEAAPFASSPVVLCRNLFIYFSEHAVRETIGFLAERMPSPGYLCVGASESLLRLGSAFTLEEIGGAFIYVKQ